MIRSTRGRRGYMLATVLIVLTIAMVLGSTLLNVSVSEFKLTKRTENRTRAYYLAKSGADAVVAWVSQNGRTMSEVTDLISGNEVNTSTPTALGDGQFYIHLSGTPYEPVIHSRGVFRDLERQVQVNLIKRSYFDSVVSVSEHLYVQNDTVKIHGNVTLINNATMDLPKKWDVDYPRINLDFSGITSAGVAKTPIDSFKHVPDKGEPSPYDDYQYVIDLGDQDTVYLENNDSKDKKVMLNNESIFVTGSGVLKLFVDSLDFKGSLIADDDATLVVIVLDGGTLDFQTPGAFDCYVLAPGADVKVQAHMQGVGAIFAKNVDLLAGAEITHNPDMKFLYPEDLDLASLGYDLGTWRGEP